ncbi:MAG: plasmid stabilization protein [Comamonas sp. SCN 65-56]|uniref:type II toxin-antitoxin system RelE/ParE family toxin n=1 Tax=Comamonas sp. SCN 65-56 TaxID=1660095 RepID=UPI00086EE83E|nr:type II toxin-antitoxin system RelE/ParE family toxin [Comamonas sp. SCN 65-56]ODS89579.1 MAG: plasmid stabilization protein [Comamonas sp. SCN 65-56]
MSFRIVLLTSAEHDLKELKGYMVKSFGKDAWQASYTKIKDAVNTIGAFPLGGNVPEELERLNLTQYRQVVAGMNRIIYEVRQEIVYIHIVCDTRKDMKSLLTRRLVRIVKI